MGRTYTSEGRVPVGAFVDPNLKEQLVERAEQKRVSLSEVIRAALLESLRQVETNSN